jgi:hypothetical protein
MVPVGLWLNLVEATPLEHAQGEIAVVIGSGR